MTPRNILQTRLDEIRLAAGERRKRLVTAGVALVGVILGLVLWGLGAIGQEWAEDPSVIFGWLVLVGTGVWVGRWWANRPGGERVVRGVAADVEERFPDLDGRLLTTMTEPPEAAPEGTERYLRKRLRLEVESHAVREDWVVGVEEGRCGWVWAQGLGLAGVVAMLTLLMGAVPVGSTFDRRVVEEEVVAMEEAPLNYELRVEPGNVEVKKGSRLMVEAEFAGGVRVPSEVYLEWHPEQSGREGESGEATEERRESLARRFPMQQRLGDPVVGAVVPAVNEAGAYRVVIGEWADQPYQVGVYEHPRLEQADVTIDPPDYAGQEKKLVKDVRKVRALEGSELSFSFQLNKEIAAGELFGENDEIIPLVADEEDPTKWNVSLVPSETQKYRLHLVDAEERGNESPPWFRIEVRPNQRPKLEMTFPGRDVDVSALQEMQVEGKVWDDLGVERVGAVIAVGEETREVVLQGDPLPGKKNHPVGTWIALEEWKARPTQLVSYHLWAEDRGPEGVVRRTEGELFFAEVREWEHIFREGAPQEGEGQPGQSQELRLEQKQIISAHWNLRRKAAGSDLGALRPQVTLIRQGQELVREKLMEAVTRVEDAELKQHLTAAGEEMVRAEELLRSVEESDGKVEEGGENDFEEAFEAEKAAYAYLLKASERETEVQRSKSNTSQGQSSQQQRQLMNLELKQEEDRYETEKKAQDEEPASEQEKELELLQKLKELARRQEAMAEKIPEQEAARQEQGNEEGERRELERLRDEQEDLLRDVDELLEQMSGEENEQRFSEDREKLEDIREQVQKAKEALKENALQEAANAARRAEREMEELENSFRERTASRFAEEARELRQGARELVERQEAIYETLENAPGSHNSYDVREAAEEREAARTKLEAQRGAVEDFLEELQEVSEQAEESEPILADALYEAVRDARMSDIDEALEEASYFSRFSPIQLALGRERDAGNALEKLSDQVERAAEMLLGDERESLRRVKGDLDELIEAAEAEMERQGDGDAGRSAAGQGEDQAGLEEGESQVGRGEDASSEGESGIGQEGEGAQGEGETGADAQEGAEPQGGAGPSGEKPTSMPGEGAGREGEQGKGKGQGEGEKGQGKGEGKGQGQEEGQGASPGGQQPGQAQGQGKGEGQREGQQASANPSGSGEGGNAPSGDQQPSGNQSGEGGQGGGLFFEQTASREEGGDAGGGGPITGEGYREWASGLRRVESMLDDPQSRSQAARALDRAREFRLDSRRHGKAPKWDLVQTTVVDPLVELRQRVAEDLARLEGEEALVPIDRDPVPGQFQELVRRYYQRLAVEEAKRAGSPEFETDERENESAP